MREIYAIQRGLIEMTDEGTRKGLEDQIQVERERRPPDEELQRCRLDLETARSELDALLYAVSHDLGAPLRAVEGFSRILFEKYSGNIDKKGQDYLARVEAAAQKLNQMVADLLQLSRHSRVEMQIEDVDLSGVAEGIANRLDRSAPERGVKFIVAENISAFGDKSLLTLVLKNILGNAWKFTREKKDAVIEFGELQYGSERAYFVRDNGIGFDMAFAARLFKPFQKLHEELGYSGSGIGLATAHRIIKRSAGKIWAESEIGKGTTIYFTLG